MSVYIKKYNLRQILANDGGFRNYLTYFHKNQKVIMKICYTMIIYFRGVENMKLGERTLKIVVATILAVILAQWLQLENSYAAGIIAILSLLDTRTDTLKIAISRLSATMIAFAIAWLLFSFMGYSIWVFGLYLLFFIPICYTFGFQAGIAPVSVLVTHFIVAKSVGIEWMINGGLLMIIGTGMSLLLNVWMPSQMTKLNQMKLNVDREMKEIIKGMAVSLKMVQCDVTAIQRRSKELEVYLEQAQQLALLEYNNQIFQKNSYHIDYLTMRKTQLDILRGLIEMLPNIPLAVDQGFKLSHLLAITAEHYDEQNTVIELIEGVADLYRYSRQSQLPQSRAEFEARAMIYAFLIEFSRFLEVKYEFYQMNQDNIAIDSARD